MSVCLSIAFHLPDDVTSVINAGKEWRAKNRNSSSQSKLCSLMWSRPFRDVRVEAGRPRVAGGKDAPCCVGSVCRGGIGHRFDFPLQFDQPCQDVIQQHSYSPLQISCVWVWEKARERKQINISFTNMKQIMFIQEWASHFMCGTESGNIWLHLTYHNQPWRSPAVRLVRSGSPPSGPWHIADWAPGSARVARCCSGAEAAAQCSAAAWDPTPGQIPSAAHSTSGTCSSAGVHPAWY